MTGSDLRTGGNGKDDDAGLETRRRCPIDVTRKAPSAARVLMTDWWCRVLLLLPLMTTGLYLALLHLGAVSFLAAPAADGAAVGRVTLAAALAVPLVALPLLVGRLYRIRSLFVHGSETPGVVTSVYSLKDSGRIDFTYVVDGVERSASSAVQLTAAVRFVANGQTVGIIHDPRDPRRALVKEIYA